MGVQYVKALSEKGRDGTEETFGSPSGNFRFSIRKLSVLHPEGDKRDAVAPYSSRGRSCM